MNVIELKNLAQKLGLEYRDVIDPNPPRDLKRGNFDRFLGAWGRSNLSIPIGEIDNEVLVATANPLDLQAIEQISFCYERPIKLLVTSSEEINKAINTMRSRLMSDRTDSLADGEGESDNELKIDVTDSDDEDAPIIRYVNSIIFKANKERASDIHMESFEDSLKVRFRIDGALYDIDSKDKRNQAAIISRLKVMAGLNIAEKRLPQDGRIGLKIAGKDVDIRVSTIPTQFGERVVMRILDKSETVLDLEQIGVEGRTLEIILKLIEKPNGIILVTGPTGSGKTTTLYSCLGRINSPELNILTVEDPIEYQLSGIGQMQVNPKIGFTFASGLRAILRQDPDVVMVGEIRDGETAEIAIQASLTGHLVLSTLHTNDAPGAINRLIDMDAEPFLVASSLLAVMAQRLVRRLCKHCKEPCELTEPECKELGLPLTNIGKPIFKKKGCELCGNLGYQGRTGIHELLVINDELRGLILQRLDSASIRNAAFKHGFQTLRMDGASKILKGQTSVEEVLMVTHEELA